MRRAFIISHDSFPRGSAGANYIQYFALALIEGGYEAIVIGQGKETKYDLSYRGIKYATLEARDGMKWRSPLCWSNCNSLLQHYGATSEDYFIFYGMELECFKGCLRLFGSKHLFAIRVEDMQPNQYKLKALTPRYLEYRCGLRYAWKNFAGVFSISTLLNEQDVSNGANSLILPIMSDPYEFDYDFQKRKGDIVQFIYPGLKKNDLQDDIPGLISALSLLSDDELKHIKLHITGARFESFMEYVDQNNYSRIKSIVIAHGFVPYEELIKIYQQSDFMILFRRDNKITRANFPSKVPELISFGVIPICSDVGDYTKRYLCSDNAIIVKRKEDYLNAIKRAISMDQREYSNMRKAARLLSEERFYYKRWTKTIIAFLENV